MATLNLTSWSILNDEDGVEVASNINPKIAKLSFGDYYVATFLYTTDLIINSNFEVRFNPGMFVTDGFKDSSNLDKPTESYYLRRSNLTTTFQQMTYVGPANSYETGRNEVYECRKVTANTFEVRMAFFMLSDTRGYLGSVTGGQSSRLTSDDFSQNPTIFANGNDTIYTTNAGLDNYCLGVYCAINFKQTNQVGITLAQSSLPYTSTAAFTATRVSGLGIDFLADGWNNPCGLGTGPRQVELTVRQINGSSTPIDYTFTGTLNPAATTSSVLYFTSSVNFPLSLGNYFTVTDFVILPCGDEFTYGIMGANSGQVKTWNFLNIDGRFVNDGSHSNRTFKLKRGGADVSNLIPTAITTIEFEFDYTGSPTIEGGRVWFIPTNIGNPASTRWLPALLRTPIQFRYVNGFTPLGGTRYRLTYNVDGVAYNLQNGQNFHLVFVTYDTINKYYAAYSMENVSVSTKIEVPTDGLNCPLEINGKLSTYRNDFSTDYLRVSPLQRVKATTYYNKLGYNACTSFNNVSRVVATLELLDNTILDTVTFNISGGVASSGGGSTLVVNLANTLELAWMFRIEDVYTDKEIRVKWVVTSTIEPTETIYYQQFRVDKYQQDIIVGDQVLTKIDFIDSDGFILDNSSRNCSGDNLIVETTRNPANGFNDYQQVAVWLDDSLNVEEEDGFLGAISGLPPLTTIYQDNVIEKFSTNLPNTTVRHEITSSVNNGEVGMIGYPPPFIPNAARVLIHNTLPNGRNVVFRVEHVMLPGTKSFATLGGVATTANFTFRVGNTTASLRDANDTNWSLFPVLTWFQFLNSGAAIGQFIRVEYNGISTQTDIPSYMDYFTTTPINALDNITIASTNARQTAGRDIMMYTGADTNFIGVTSTNVNRYTGKRTVAELAASSDLVTYTPYLPVISAAIQPPNSTTGNHLFVEDTAVGALDNFTLTTQVLAPNLTLSSLATPIYNFAYPITGDGINPKSIFLDGINDDLYFVQGGDFNFANVPDNSYICFQTQILGNVSNGFTGLYSSTLISNPQRSLAIWNDGRLQIGFLSEFGAAVMVADIYFYPSAHYTVQIFLKKKGNPAGYSPISDFFDLASCFCIINGRKLGFYQRDGAFGGSPPFPVGDCEVRTGRWKSTNYTSPIYVTGKVHDFRYYISPTQPSLEECREYAVGNKTKRQYQWDYENVVFTNQLAFTGSASAPNITLYGHANSTTDFF